MDIKKAPRKKRVDRTHAIYMLYINGRKYIGVTARTESTVIKSVRTRINKHWYRAQTETKDWLLCEAMRGLQDRSEIEFEILATVRGKADAHREEVRLRRKFRPELNTDCRCDDQYA